MTSNPPLADLFPLAGSLPADFAELLGRDVACWLVDGELRAWSGPREEVFSPVLERAGEGLRPIRLGSVPRLCEEQAMQALDAASAAYSDGDGPWPSLPAELRIQALERLADLIAPLRESVARLIAWEVGKSLSGSLAEFDRTMECLRETAQAARDLEAEWGEERRRGGILARVGRRPLGVVLCLGPFNYPFNETLATLAPALVMGNTAVLKAPRIGRLCLAAILEPLRAAFPPGVVNVLFGGPELAGGLMATGRIDALAFIGTSRAAAALAARHPRPNRLRQVLGLEAKNAAVVLADADLDLAVAECLRGALAFNGQRCTALKMLWVARAREQEFLERLTQGVRALRLGMPWEPGVDITPLPEPERPAYLSGLLADALERGARLLNPGGGECCGTLFAPALLGGVGQHMRIAREEQFGPVVPVAAFDDISQPLSAIAASDHGQQAGLFGSDPDTLERVADRLSRLVCRVNLNCKCQRGPDDLPFTGRKDSALGDMSTPAALRAFSIEYVLARRFS